MLILVYIVVHTKQALRNIYVPTEALGCNNVNCASAAHKQNIDCFYKDICNVLLDCSKKCIDTKQANSTYKHVPGWNDYVKDLYTDSREAFVLWRDLGKPRNGPVSELMRRSRLSFKYALRQCQRQEKVLRANAMARDLENKDVRSFWGKVSKIQNKKLPAPTHVNGCYGEQDIAHMWKAHYESIMNCVTNEANKADVMSSLSDITCDNRIVITTDCVKEALKDIKKGKAAGLDGLAAEHFVYADSSLCVLLSLLFTCMLTHGHLPPLFMQSAILPIIKNKTGDTADKSNYRPVAIVSPCSKLFEVILLFFIEEHVLSHDNQFGFKKKHSTDLCIFALKNVVDYYKKCSSPVFSCFLDASKAFDRINHWTLFKKMVDKNVPIVIIRILLYWYRQQDVSIKWGQCISSPFKVTNGLRQGSLVSPKMFALYVNDLSDLLIRSNVGCYIDSVCINHLFYADDLCLMAPTAIALQKLINICSMYGIDHDIVYNPSKSICVVFKPNGYKLHCPSVSLNDSIIAYSASAKYLGVIITAKLNDNDEIVKQCRGLYARSYSFLRKFTLCSDNVKLQLFQTFCTNIYAAHLWSSYNVQSYNKVKVAYNNAYRAIFGCDRFCSASNMFVSNNVATFDCMLRKAVFKFKARAAKSENALVNTLYNNYDVKG